MLTMQNILPFSARFAQLHLKYFPTIPNGKHFNYSAENLRRENSKFEMKIDKTRCDFCMSNRVWERGCICASVSVSRAM